MQGCARVPFLVAHLAKPAQQGLCEGAVEVTLMHLPWFRAEHQHLGCFWSWKTFPCCGFGSLWMTWKGKASWHEQQGKKEMKGFSALSLSWEGCHAYPALGRVVTGITSST